jgi:hypothetical protein
MIRTWLRLGLGLVFGVLLGAAPASAQNRFNLTNNTGQMIDAPMSLPRGWIAGARMC